MCATQGVCDSVYVFCCMCLRLSAHDRMCVCVSRDRVHACVSVCVYDVFLSLSAPVAVYVCE